MTVRKTNDIALPTAPSMPNAIDSTKHAQSRSDSHRGTPCKSESKKNECDSRIVESHQQQMTITLPDAPLVWQAFHNAEAGFPVDAAQILSGAFDFEVCDSRQMADKIAKQIAEYTHDDSSFMGRFLDQIVSVNDYIDSVVNHRHDEEVAEQVEHLFNWGDMCLIVFFRVLQRITVQNDAKKEQLRLEKEQLRLEKEQLRLEKEQLRLEKERLRLEQEQWRLEKEQLLNELDDLFRGLPVQ